MTKNIRHRFSTNFKAKLVIEALSERSTMMEIVRKYELHPEQINTWKREGITNMAAVFNGDKIEINENAGQQTEKSYSQMGQLKVGNDFLKKTFVRPLGVTKIMIDNRHTGLSIVQQCRLLSLHRNRFYYQLCAIVN